MHTYLTAQNLSNASFSRAHHLSNEPFSRAHHLSNATLPGHTISRTHHPRGYIISPIHHTRAFPRRCEHIHRLGSPRSLLQKGKSTEKISRKSTKTPKKKKNQCMRDTCHLCFVLNRGRASFMCTFYVCTGDMSGRVEGSMYTWTT